MAQHISHGGDLLGNAVKEQYEAGLLDYGMEPLVRIGSDGKPMGRIRPGDAVIFCCRRGEREIELTEAFTEKDFPHFTRENLAPLDFVILTMYHEKFKDLPIAFAPSKVQETLAESIAKAGKTQFHCAESEKYAHVTFFFNGGNNEPAKGETDVKIPSVKGVPFDQVPELSLPAVADEVEKALDFGYDFIVTNFANGDVIGHTANNEAKVACAQYVDKHLGRVVEHAKKNGYVVAVTADHGNLEVMTTPEGKPHVAHTSNLVPFLLIDPAAKTPVQPLDGRLGDISPTVLQVLGLPRPAGMSGKSLAPDVDFGKDRKMLLIILDGWGLGAEDDSNPIHLAKTPVLDALYAAYPMGRLHASGEDVGLQQGKAGNSEAGHINIGSGRIVPQDDVRLDNAMKDGSFETNPVFLKTIADVQKRGGALHLFSLLTKKSTHGSIDYPLALIKMAKALPEVYVHVIFDGRSTEPGSAPALLSELDGLIEAAGHAEIVDGIGRGIALDRDNNYAKIKKAYDLFVRGEGNAYC